MDTKYWKLHWLGNKVEFVRGLTIAEAFLTSKYRNVSLDYYEETTRQEYLNAKEEKDFTFIF